MMMQKNLSSEENVASIREHEDQQVGSVYEFLYCDNNRIGSYLSQFDNYGHIQQIKHIDRVTKSTKRGFKFGVGGGASVIGTGGSGNISFERGPETTGGEESIRIYNPLWSNALSFLDHLNEREMLIREVEDANIGQFVLSRGKLSIVDHQMMQQIWALPTVKKLMLAGSTPPGNRNERRKGKKLENEAEQSLELFREMISILPHGIQGSLLGENEIWFSLNNEHLATESSAIILKHGTNIPGEWFALGILDAKPDALEYADADGVKFTDAEEMSAKMMGIIAPIARNMLGRPHRSFGITPLILFREVKH